MNVDNYQNIPQSKFIRVIKDNKNDCSYIFLLGAGASISSGVPSAEQLIWAWKRDIYEDETGDVISKSDIITNDDKIFIQEWLDSQNGKYPPKGSSDEYSIYAENRFIDEQSRKIYFDRLIENKKPSKGYHKLVLLLKEQFSKIVLTTNFDSLTEKAAIIGNSIFPRIITCETAKQVHQAIGKNNFLYVALHGDFKYSRIINTDAEFELDKGNDEFVNFLKYELKKQHLIVIGYSGRDITLMDALKESYNAEGGGNIYWCSVSGTISEQTKMYLSEIARTRKVYIVKIDDFDTFIESISKAYISHSSEQHMKLESIKVLEAEQLELINKKKSNILKAKTNFHSLTHDQIILKAMLLKYWIDENQGDRTLIEDYLNTNYDNFIIELRKNSNSEYSDFHYKKGIWELSNCEASWNRLVHHIFPSDLDLFKTLSLQVLSEIHPMFDLKPEDRFAAAIHGKTSKYSSELRKGISETLAFLGVHGSKLINCTQNKPEITSASTIREIFHDADWKLWASLNDVLPILAESAPNEFLSSVEKACNQLPCPFDELFCQEGQGGVIGANYMTGLYWALETLSWSDQYLSRSILALAKLAAHDPGGGYVNRPINSISTILLPWIPQTTASVDIRIASLVGIRRYFPDIAWKIVIGLLPNQHQTSFGSHKPFLQSFIPKDWKQEISKDEYREQILAYANIAVDMAKGNMKYTADLVKNLDNIPQPSYSEFLDYLSSDDIVKQPDEQKQPIWETMISFIKKHRRFSDAKWALPSEMVDLIQKTADVIIPSKPEVLYRYLFSNNDFDLFDKDIEWKTQQELLLKQRIDAIKQIYELNKTESVIYFAGNVENPSKVGNAFAHIAHEENDKELLPTLLDSQQQFKKQMVSGYINSRYNSLGAKWIDTQHVENWTIEQKCALLFNVPFEIEIWEKAHELLGEDVGVYWKNINVNPFPTQSNLLPAVNAFLQYDRPSLALDCIYAHYFSKKEFFKEHAIEALLKGNSSYEIASAMNSHYIIEIIKMLQDDTQINVDQMLKIEWAYLPLLERYNNAEPKLLEKHLSQNSELFMEAIQLIYRSKKQSGEQKTDEARKSNALNAWKLLNEWKYPPGKLDDGSFSTEALIKWVNEVRIKTIESGHYEVAMTHLGHVLFYVDSDPSGLWIHQCAAELLDNEDDDHIRQGFSSEVYNSRGVYTVDPSGKQERELSDVWRKRAEEIEKLGLIRFASSLKILANSYDREAERVIADFANELKSSDDEGISL